MSRGLEILAEHDGYGAPWMVKRLLVRMLAGMGYSGPAGEGEAWNDRGHLTSR